MGPYVVRDLQGRGHTVAALHRGRRTASLPAGVQHIIGDCGQIAEQRENITHFGPDVIIHFILSSGRQAEAVMQNLRGLTGRIVVLSSMDVYRAVGVTFGTEPGPPEPLPLTEESAVRTRKHMEPPMVGGLRRIFEWVDEDYDKVPVERVVLGDAQLPGTVLRLPMVYGPGDPLHRFYPIVKRVQDGRRKIIFSEEAAAWRCPRGYVENVAVAIALAAVSERAAGRIYNIAEWPAYSEQEWSQKIATEMHWEGEFVLLPAVRTPKHLASPGNAAQHWVASSERIRKELGYREPVGLEQAITRTTAWEKVNPPTGATFFQFDYEAEDAALAV